MKKLIFLITIIAVTLHVRAGENEEIIWETEQIGGINDVLVSPLGDIFYNVTGSTIQIRSIEDGTLIDFFIPEDMPNHITHISITDDARYMAMSGDNPHIVIYDLQEQKEVKRFTTTVFEREENGTQTKYKTKRWLSSSISPDGTKVTGVAEGDQATYSTCWLVIDIVSGDELVKESRLGYDYLNPENSSNFWITSEYTPDGNYIVSQLDWGGGGQSGPDSIYIHDVNTFEVYDVVLNSYNSTDSEILFSKFESIFCVPNEKSVIFYYLNEKNSHTIFFSKSTRNIVFSALDRNLLIRNGLELPKVFDYENEKFKQQINYVGVPQIATLDNKVIYRPAHFKGLALIEFDWNLITTIEENIRNNSNLSPNPSTGDINIQLNNQFPSEFSYELISISGQIVKSNSLGFIESQSQIISINISKVPNGQYSLRIFSGQEEIIFSIVKGG